MKLAVISDIHSNLHALEAVLDHISSFRVDKLACLGDVISYGGYPDECASMVLKECDVLIRGNHESAILNEDYSKYSSERGAKSAEETRRMLSKKNLHEIELYFEPHRVLEMDGKKIMLLHGSLSSEWVLATSDHEKDHIYSMYDYVIFGHSHVPFLCTKKLNGNKKRTTFCNPGSVGQPRDGNPRASWMMIDTETGEVSNHRVNYDFQEAALAVLNRTGNDDYYSRRLLSGD